MYDVVVLVIALFFVGFFLSLELSAIKRSIDRLPSSSEIRELQKKHIKSLERLQSSIEAFDSNMQKSLKNIKSEPGE